MSEDFHAPVHAPSERQPTEDEALKVVLVDQSRDAQDEARDRADARLDQELGEGGKFKQFLNGIWKGNIAKDFYRQRYIHQELDTIKSAESVHINEDADRRSQARHQRIKFRISPRRTAAHNSQLVWQAQSRAPQGIGNGLTPNHGRNERLCCS